jgi:hypothetical protein
MLLAFEKTVSEAEALSALEVTLFQKVLLNVDQGRRVIYRER